MVSKWKNHMSISKIDWPFICNLKMSLEEVGLLLVWRFCAMALLTRLSRLDSFTAEMQSWMVRGEEACKDDEDCKREPHNVENLLCIWCVVKRRRRRRRWLLCIWCPVKRTSIGHLDVGCWCEERGDGKVDDVDVENSKNGRGSPQFLKLWWFGANSKIMNFDFGRWKKWRRRWWWKETLRNASYESF